MEKNSKGGQSWKGQAPNRREDLSMPQRPNALSLMLCDQVVFEQGTQKPYLLGVFTGVAAERFPTLPQRFDVFAALTDGVGDVIINLSVMHLETNEEVYARSMRVSFPDQLQVVNLRFRVRQMTYEVAGTYLFALMIDNHEVAARRVNVYQRRGLT
jgi:hypothetical protein